MRLRASAGRRVQCSTQRNGVPVAIVCSDAMVDLRGLLVVLHILLAIAWLGVDAGVFLGSHLIRNRAYSPDARFLVSRLMGYLDLSPRLAVQLTFAVGGQLAYLSGWIRVPEWAVWVT